MDTDCPHSGHFGALGLVVPSPQTGGLVFGSSAEVLMEPLSFCSLRVTNTRPRTQLCSTGWSPCLVWAGSWRRVCTRMSWSRSGPHLRRSWSLSMVLTVSWSGRLTAVACGSVLRQHVSSVFAAVGLGHVDENAGAEERPGVHHSWRVPLLPFWNHRPQHERILPRKNPLHMYSGQRTSSVSPLNRIFKPLL